MEAARAASCSSRTLRASAAAVARRVAPRVEADAAAAAPSSARSTASTLAAPSMDASIRSVWGRRWIVVEVEAAADVEGDVARTARYGKDDIRRRSVSWDAAGVPTCDAQVMKWDLAYAVTRGSHRTVSQNWGVFCMAHGLDRLQEHSPGRSWA